VVAPNWAADFCTANKIPFIPWDFLRLNDRSHDIAEKLKAEGVDVAKEDIVRFMKRVNQTLLHLDGDPDDPIHVKAFDKAGCLGHRMIRKIEDISLRKALGPDFLLW